MLYPDVITAAKSITDQSASDQGGTLAEHTLWLGGLYPAMVRRVADILPGRYTSAVLSEIVDGTPTDPIGNFHKIRKVERQITTNRYVLIPEADYNLAGNTGRICWRQIGGDIEVFPTGITGTFRIEYIPVATLPEATVQLDLPPGLELCLVHDLAKMIRIRLNQDFTVHERESARIWTEVTSSLVPQASSPRGISDYERPLDDGCIGGEWWRG